MIGDRLSDLESGRNAGCRQGILVDSFPRLLGYFLRVSIPLTVLSFLLLPVNLLNQGQGNSQSGGAT